MGKEAQRGHWVLPGVTTLAKLGGSPPPACPKAVRPCPHATYLFTCPGSDVWLVHSDRGVERERVRTFRRREDLGKPVTDGEAGLWRVMGTVAQCP